MKNISIPNQFKSVIKVLFTLTILFFITKNIKLELLSEHLNGAEYEFLTFASFAFITGVCINTLRLKLFFNEDIAYYQLLKINFIGLFFSIFLPGRTSGDVVRGYYIEKSLKNLSQTISILMVWRLIGTFTMVFISCIMSFFSYSIIKDKSIIYYPISIFIILVLFIIILLNPKLFLPSQLYSSVQKFRKIALGKSFSSIHSDLMYMKNKPRLIPFNIILSIISNFFMLFTWYFISQSIHANISIQYIIIFIPLVSILQAIPISLNGMGIREGAAVYLFSKIGIMKEISFIMALFYSTISILISLVGGLVYLLYRNEVLAIDKTRLPN